MIEPRAGSSGVSWSLSNVTCSAHGGADWHPVTSVQAGISPSDRLETLPSPKTLSSTDTLCSPSLLSDTRAGDAERMVSAKPVPAAETRSEEHTSELQSRPHL